MYSLAGEDYGKCGVVCVCVCVKKGGDKKAQTQTLKRHILFDSKSTPVPVNVDNRQYNTRTTI